MPAGHPLRNAVVGACGTGSREFPPAWTIRSLNQAAHSGLERLRSHARLLIVIAALLLLYTLGGFLLVPHVARSAIIGYVQKNMGGRHASIGELKFNPFTFTVRNPPVRAHRGE